MGMAELETSPLRITVGFPTLLTTSKRQNVGPANRLLAPTQGLGHGFPHGNHDRREDEIVGLPNQVFAELALRLRVSKFYKRAGCRTDDMWLVAAFQDLVDGLPGSHCHGAYINPLAAAGAMFGTIEIVGDLGDPLLFFRPVRKNQLQRICWHGDGPVFLVGLRFAT